MPDLDDEEEMVQAAAQEACTAVIRAFDANVPGDVQLTPAVFVPPGLRMALADTRTAREFYEDKLAEGWTPPTVEDDRLRIQRELDPVGMAIAIAQGMSIPVYVPKGGGEIKVTYVQVPTKTRIQVLNKLLDRASPQQSKTTKKQETPASVDAHAFLSMVRRAADIAQTQMRGARLIDAEAVLVDAPPTEEEARMIDEGTTDQSEGSGSSEGSAGERDT